MPSPTKTNLLEVADRIVKDLFSPDHNKCSAILSISSLKTTTLFTTNSPAKGNAARSQIVTALENVFNSHKISQFRNDDFVIASIGNFDVERVRYEEVMRKFCELLVEGSDEITFKSVYKHYYDLITLTTATAHKTTLLRQRWGRFT